MANVIGLSQEHEDNLRKLAGYLMQPTLRAKFDMVDFVGEISCLEMSRLTECGTIGCAVGHGPYAGIPKSKDEIWSFYSYRVFGLEDDYWDFCFSDIWGMVDNTPHGAAKRILVLLDSGLPEDWEEQMRGGIDINY